MKYCKNCGVLYNTDVCPKCGIAMPEPEPPVKESDLTPEQKKQQKRSWLGILIGIPAFIGFIYLIIFFYTRLSAGL